ncbi:MAG: hypothetical protein KDD67_15995 [Ignavibacteriae bacterium]|nr:hypothetical protein [Ignavibacteriota bacterium]MCB9215675.1 hypothetical protein [Ignavibacteria bacterium]
MTDKNPLTKSDLAQFYGTKFLYRHALVSSVCYTDGIKYMAEKGEAYWLIDEIAFAQKVGAVAAEEFQHWTLKVSTDQSAVLKCSDGNDKIVSEEPIPFTDFPLDEISIYYTNNVILLPSEY